MINTGAERRDRFSVDIYRKKDNRAELVFRKGKLLYRINAIEGCSRLVTQLSELIVGKTKVISLRNSRNRKWAVEAVVNEQAAAVVVWELMADGRSLMRFGWQGTAAELKR